MGWQVAGVKVWYLLSWTELTEANSIDLRGKTPQNCYGINPHTGPGVGKPWRVAVVHPGNVMVVLIGVWHYVKAYGECVSLNAWYTQEDIDKLDLGGPRANDCDETVVVDSPTVTPTSAINPPFRAMS